MTCEEIKAAYNASNDEAEKADLIAQWTGQSCGTVRDLGSDDSGPHTPSPPPK